MKKILLITILSIFLTPVTFANEKTPLFKTGIFNNDTREIKSLLHSQVKWANKTNFEKFIDTYDNNYISADGFNLDTYSNLVKDIWKTYDNLVYGVKIKNIDISENSAKVQLTETSYADISISKQMDGCLKNYADSVYYLVKNNGKWKVLSDEVITETTSLMYGDAQNLDIKLTAPLEIPANTEYTASLEFTPPKDSIAIASIAMDKVEYPQKKTQEVFRKFPEDNILERLFVSNSDNANEYIVASIGLTKADICDLNIKLSLTGFGYQITRVNVVSQNKEGKNATNK